MTKKIVYIHPGDMIELRVCDPTYPATAADWNRRSRPQYVTIAYNDGVEVFDTISNLVWSGTGASRRQMFVGRTV